MRSRRLPIHAALKKPLWIAIWLTASVGVAVAGRTGGWAHQDTAGVSQVTGQAEIARSELPAEGQETYRLILAGGPFPYEKDGVVFGNRERLLPRHPRGYYREYTVSTPGSRDRGARRIVCGGWQASHPEACFYSSDHYANFRQIVNSK